MMGTQDFAQLLGISRQAAHKVFADAARGKKWKGHTLPVVQVPGQRGGKGGAVWVLNTARCDLVLQAKLLPAATPVEAPSKGVLKGRVDDRHIAIAMDKARIIAPILATAKHSAERARMVEEIAARPFHVIGGDKETISERTLYEWIKAAEENPAALVPQARADRGVTKVMIGRRWDQECPLSDETKAGIAAELEEFARGLIMLGRSERDTRKKCSSELVRLTAAAGLDLPRAALERLCDVPMRWVLRFTEMKSVHKFKSDHKAFADKDEYHVRHCLTARPMEVLMGDVHHVDVTTDKAISSPYPEIVQAGYQAIAAGKQKIKALLIGWMDGSSGYMWITPVICGPGQSVTASDVARSLFDVLSCPWGGMPKEFRIDNGSEFKALDECVTRFIAMADLAGLGVVRCRPYHPEGKARLEGAFRIIKERFISALPGYNGGNPMKPRLQGRGKPVAPYDRGAERLLADLHLAGQQYNGTAQEGRLEGLSPKAVLEGKIAATGWTADRITDPNMFDLVFSLEERRDVRQGTVTIGKRQYSGPVLAELIGAKQVPFYVPLRDPEGAILYTRVEGEGEAKRLVIHRLENLTFAMNDEEGAKHRAKMVSLQHDELRRREAKGRADLDIQQMNSDAADLGPVQHNPPNEWSFSALDKGGFIGAPISAEEARARQDAEDRAEMEEFLALARAGKDEASGCNR